MGCALGAQERVNKEETQTLPLSITPNQTKPNQTKPNQTKPIQTKPKKKRPITQL
jgi:hypothetical protein